nr:PREDICTED: smoothelin [Apteryx mantelli mantelli]
MAWADIDGREGGKSLASQQLEEEQQKALASLSQKLESITDVEELTKLLRGASEYEERKLIRAAIRKLRAEEIEAATLAGNVQSSRRDDAEPPTLPGRVESGQRGESVQPALPRSRESSQRDDAEPGAARGRNMESSQRGNTEPLTVTGSVESSRRGDDEPPTLAGSMESSHRGDAEPLAAKEREPTEAERSAGTVGTVGQVGTSGQVAVGRGVGSGGGVGRLRGGVRPWDDARRQTAATLAGNVQSSRRDDAEPPTLPGRVESGQRGESVQPALPRSRESSQRDDAEPGAARGRNMESSQRGNTEPLTVTGSVESSRRGDDEPPTLAGSMESSHRGDAEPLAAKEREPTEAERSAAHEQGNVVEQEHIRTEIQELRSEQQRAPEKPNAQDAASGTLALLDLHQAPESCPAPEPEPKEHAEELEQGQPRSELAAQAELQYRASWKEKSPESPSATREPGAEQLETSRSVGGSCRVEQALPQQPCAVSQGSQFVVCVRGQAPEKMGNPPVEKQAAPAQRGAGSPARLDTHRWEQAPSSLRPAGRAGSACPGSSEKHLGMFRQPELEQMYVS